jgi:endoglucanase
MKFRWQSTGAHSGAAGDPAVVNKQKPWRGLKRRHTIVAAGALVACALGIGASVLASSAPSSAHAAASLASAASPASSASPGSAAGPAGPETAVPLHTDGGNIVDAAGKPVTLTGVNWFGFETGTFAPDGLYTRNYKSMLDQIVASGFNAIRLPYSNALFRAGNTPNINYQVNPDLKGLQGLALMDKIINAATARGLMVILDQHRPDQYAQSDLPASGSLSEQQWIDDWVMLAQHYRNNPLVIGADLHNEPHGEATWGTGNPQTDWRLMAEKAGDAVLQANPNWLIFVEGIDNFDGHSYWWGGDLAGAKRYPVQLSVPNHLVYEAHDYGPGVSYQTWFGAKNFPDNLPGIWERNWAYLKDQGIAPVLLGEFGGQSMGSDTEGTWQTTLISFLKQHGIGYTYWSWNPDSGDTGGILNYDWQTVNNAKLNVLRTYQAPLIAGTARLK